MGNGRLLIAGDKRPRREAVVAAPDVVSTGKCGRRQQQQREKQDGGGSGEIDQLET